MTTAAMTPAEALNVLYQAAGLAPLVRAQHMQVDAAATVLGKHLAPPSPAAPAAPPEARPQPEAYPS